MKETEKINIVAEPQMDSRLCRFRIDYQLFDGVVNCRSREMAAGSPLLEGLFALAGIKEVLVSGGTVTVMKDGDDDWRGLGQKIGAVIREKIASGQRLIDPAIKTKKPPTDAKLREKVQQVFDEYINPGIATHGGSVEIIDLQGTTLFLTMSGGCQGCASASYTLRYGVEQILREQVPEITEIVDVTNHGAGNNPYF